MFSFFKKEKWAHLKTDTYSGFTYAAGSNNEEKDLRLYIHYYESDKGNRKIESVCSSNNVGQEMVDNFIMASNTYQTKTKRWLNGRYDPEIPRYSEIGEEDTANALRGKVA